MTGSVHEAGMRSGTREEKCTAVKGENISQYSYALTVRTVTYRRGGQAQDRAILNVIAILLRLIKIKAEVREHFRHILIFDSLAWN